MRDLADYYSQVGYLKASGLLDAQAHALAEEAMTMNDMTDALASDAAVFDSQRRTPCAHLSLE